MNKKQLMDQIKRHEGVRYKVYSCPANKLTVGVGRNLEDLGLSQAEVDFLLDNDINRCIKELESAFPFYKDLDEARRGVLINMCFNIGISRLRRFKKTMAYIEQGDYDKASVEMLDSLWAKQVGKRAIELSKIMKEGE